MSERRRVTLEAVCLAALAVVPLIPYLVWLARHPLGRFAVDGDYTGLEIATRYVFTGRTLLGPYSRFGFNHPGPLYFFVLGPIYVLLGRTTTALWAGATLVNAAAAATVVATVRLTATRVHALAAFLPVAAWLAAFGDACPQHWNPMVVILPLLAFLVCSAQVARARSALIPAALFFGELVVETHLSTVPTVVGVSLVAGIAYAMEVPRRGRFTRADARAAAVGVAVLAPGAVPVAVEQLTSPLGNVTRIVHFFRNAGPLKPARVALVQWIDATSWLPERIDGTLATEGGPQIMASEGVPDVASPFATRVALLWVIAVVVACAVAIRRHDEASLALLGSGCLANALAVLALRAAVGETRRDQQASVRRRGAGGSGRRARRGVVRHRSGHIPQLGVGLQAGPSLGERSRGHRRLPGPRRSAPRDPRDAHHPRAGGLAHRPSPPERAH